MITYWIITNRGYWGKGETLLEAAKNASVNETKSAECFGTVYMTSDLCTENPYVSDFGTLNWTWKEDYTEEMRKMFLEVFHLGKFHLWRRGETLTMIPLLEKDAE